MGGSKCCALFWLIFSLNVYAKAPVERYVHFGGWSKHFDNETIYNETHNAIGVSACEYYATEIYGCLGIITFKNSLYKQTILGNLHFRKTILNNYPFRLEAGIVTGIGKGYESALVMAPEAIVRYRRTGIRFICVPNIGEEIAGFCSVDLEWRYR